ncbi:MAG: CoA ester lyase [Microcella sp.]|uniref:HpcH/HpaI aldolase/citrate lyase family protein n=1 Tax=Microcella sp. TaxID=1913979 RepID=UPI002716D26F|nr:CoA ester lyase [Microcella sp.]MDO8336815.1 CoA ester lyase [Microcella sp.]
MTSAALGDAGFALGPAILFVPGDRPERFAKAAERADAVIIDLEDAVAPADKERAREALRASDLDPTRTIVRVNARGTADHALDVAAVRETGYRILMLPKAESAADAAALAADLSNPTGCAIVALVETAAGVLAAEELAAEPSVVALMWGAEDLVASLGGTSSRGPDGRYRDVARHARARVLLAAGGHGIAAIDAVHLDIADLDGLGEEARDAVAQGFAATACIHPGQVETIRAAYRPSAEEVVWARGVLNAASAAGASGVFAHEGRMVDEPVLRHARRVLQRAGE